MMDKIGIQWMQFEQGRLIQQGKNIRYLKPKGNEFSISKKAKIESIKHSKHYFIWIKCFWISSSNTYKCFVNQYVNHPGLMFLDLFKYVFVDKNVV